MGYFFTILFITTSYLTPYLLFGQLTEYHVEIILVVLALLTTLPNISGSGAFTTTAAKALYGMAFAVVAASVAGGWLGGIAAPLYQFLQPVIAYFLVTINCKRKWHFNVLVLALVLSSIFYLLKGYQDLRNEVSPSLYLYGEGALRRLRGLGWVNDPNDYSQIVISLIPLLFFWRRQKSFGLNILLVGVPMAALLMAMFLTHSRGAALALMVVVLVAARRKVGTLPAGILAGAFFAISLAVGWSGGRDTSMEAGADRLDLWAGGLELIRSHPLFGVGAGRFSDFMGITAHNSVVVCAAEIGMIGLFFWVLLLFTTFRTAINLNKTAVAMPVSEGDTESVLALQSVAVKPEHKGFQQNAGINDFDESEAVLDPDEIRRMARLLVVSLAGFLTASWFLSRTFSVWLFMCCGIMTALNRIGIQRGMTPPQDSFTWQARYAALISVLLLVAVYVILRSRNL